MESGELKISPSIFEGDSLLLHIGIEECCVVYSVGSL